MTRVFNIVGVTLAAMLFGAGCGVYTFNPGGKSSIQTIAVDRFENETVELGLEDQVTNGVIDAIIADGSLDITAADNADAVLNGTLLRYERKPYSYTAGDVVESYAITMNFEITLVNSADGTEMWTERMEQTGIYAVDTETEEDAQNKALQRLVESILSRTTKSW